MPLDMEQGREAVEAGEQMTSDVSQKAREVIQKWFNTNTNLDIVGSLVPVIEAYGLRRAIEQARHIQATVQKMFDAQKEAGPTEQRVTLSWVLGCCRQDIAALKAELEKLEGK